LGELCGARTFPATVRVTVRDLDAEFAAFWSLYPRKRARYEAQKAYARARAVASAEAILDGVERYKQLKPSYADWAYPATWLNQGRWMDEADTLAAVRETEPPITAQERERAVQWLRAVGGGCPHTPRCETSAGCVGVIVRSWRRAERGE